MDESSIRRILEEVSSGMMPVEEAIHELRHLPYADIGFAKIDHHRELRAGIAETVYGPGKTPGQTAEIVAELLRGSDGPVLVTRADEEQYRAVLGVAPEAQWHPVPRLVVARPSAASTGATVLVATAGTSDLPVAEEAAVTAEALGLKVERLPDVGVAGLHRILSARDSFERAEVVIVVAGMDGVLPSIVGGLVGVPVVAVPTSVGYGAGAGGIAPLLTMLNSCAPGVAVVNVDNGYGAAVFAHLILALRA
ncbi:MAG: nickel pincer cofactor biosynthesis protein LarB [Actinomycetota bacterium]